MPCPVSRHYLLEGSRQFIAVSSSLFLANLRIFVSNFSRVYDCICAAPFATIFCHVLGRLWQFLTSLTLYHLLPVAALSLPLSLPPPLSLSFSLSLSLSLSLHRYLSFCYKHMHAHIYKLTHGNCSSFPSSLPSSSSSTSLSSACHECSNSCTAENLPSLSPSSLSSSLSSSCCPPVRATNNCK